MERIGNIRTFRGLNPELENPFESMAYMVLSSETRN